MNNIKRTKKLEVLPNKTSSINAVVLNNKPKKLYNKNEQKTIQKIHNFLIIATAFFFTLFIKIDNVRAIEKIEGGNLTEKDLKTMIYDTATTLQGVGIFIAFIVLVVFVIQFIYGDDELKQRRKKTILYTLGGIILLILVPSLINLIIDSLVVSET